MPLFSPERATKRFFFSLSGFSPPFFSRNAARDEKMKVASFLAGAVVVRFLPGRFLLIHFFFPLTGVHLLPLA